MLFSTTVTLALASASLSVASSSSSFVLEERSSKVFKAPLKRHSPPGTKSHHILSNDAARLASYKSAVNKNSESAITNSGVSYLVNVGFGTPAIDYSLVLDTGSANTWASRFAITDDAISTGKKIAVQYGSGNFSGTEYTDTITLTSGLVLKNQGVGRAMTSSGFGQGADGIIGLGPVGLTRNTVKGVKTVPTVMQNAVSQKKISKSVLGVFFAPPSSTSDSNGEITYGGVDSSRYVGSLTYQSVTTKTSAKDYWGITISSSLGSSRSGIVDTGTTLIYLPTSWYTKWIKSITGAKVDAKSGLVRIPKSSLNKIPDITFNIGGQKFVLNKYAQLVEKVLYKEFGLSSGYLYSWIGDNGSDDDLAFLLGQKFMERYYTVYDADSKRIGFAKTKYSTPTYIP